MQKKLIALAVAGLVSAPVFAQSNVTVYGLISIGAQYNSGGEETLDDKTYKNRTGIDSGLQNGSRLGFRGTEDLGNGMKAGFHLAYDLSADGDSKKGLSNRESNLSLSGGFGTVMLGRVFTPQNVLVGKVDPFGDTTAGAVTKTYSQGVFMSKVTQIDNTIVYVTPTFGGLSVAAAFTNSGIGDEQLVAKGEDSENARIWAIAPSYTNGPLFVGANYHRVTVDANAALKGKDIENNVWDIGTTYDFGVVKLAALYGESKVEGKDEDGKFDGKQKQWLVGASAPVGAAGLAKVSYVRTDIEGDKVGKWALGYDHRMSKRTSVFAAYAVLDSDKELEGVYSVRSSADLLAGTAGDGFEKGFQVGLRHTF